MVSYLRAERVEKPLHFRIAPLTSHRTARRPYVIGFDSEAEAGKPFMFQFGHPDERCDIVHVSKKRHEAIRSFFSYVRDNCRGKENEYIIFGFNLSYEWTQLFAELPRSMKVASEFHVIIDYRENESVHVSALNEKRYMLTIEFGRRGEGKSVCKTCNANGVDFVRTSHRAIRLIDARAFITTSLDQAGKIIGAGSKLQKPKHFSRRYAHTSEFIAYAKQDAILTQKLGEYITSLHEQYDVTQCISAPHFAAKVFRRQFLRDEVKLPHPDLEQFGLWSYHGGKNGFYLTQPALLDNIYHYDIRSAYPEAMRRLPDLVQGTFEFYDRYIPNAHAIWKATISYTKCRYRAFQSEDGSWPDSGIVTIYTTGYELDAALDHGECNIIACEGYVFDGPEGGALTEYVDTFYEMKRNAPTSAEKTTAKLFLNSLYGKFFQKVPANDLVESISLDEEQGFQENITDPESEYDWRAGGLYHPPIASLITGSVRAKIHRLEHKYQSLMTSTDGFFATEPPDPTEIGNELGQLSVEKGKLRIWRERTYVFTPYDGTSETFAMHGFSGTKEQLLRMPMDAGAIFMYDAQQMVTLRLSETAYRGTQPGEFIIVPKEITLPGLATGPPKLGTLPWT